jgi:hypothetical protein
MRDLIWLWDGGTMRSQGRPKAQKCVERAGMVTWLGKWQLAQNLEQHDLYPQNVEWISAHLVDFVPEHEPHPP